MACIALRNQILSKCLNIMLLPRYYSRVPVSLQRTHTHPHTHTHTHTRDTQLLVCLTQPTDRKHLTYTWPTHTHTHTHTQLLVCLTDRTAFTPTYIEEM